MNAIVEGDIHPELRTGVQEPLPVGVFAHDADRIIGWNAVRPVGQTAPGLSEIIRLEDVRRKIVLVVLVNRDMGAPRRMRGRIDHVHGAVVRHSLRRDVLPVLSFVPRQVNHAIITARPQHSACRRRFLERENGSPRLEGRAVQDEIVDLIGHRIAGMGQVGTDHLP